MVVLWIHYCTLYNRIKHTELLLDTANKQTTQVNLQTQLWIQIAVLIILK